MKTIIFTLTLLFALQVAAEDLNSVFNETADLTDEQAKQSKDFVHQGIKDQVITEGCKDLKNCTIEDDNGGVEKIIGQVYSTALPMVLSQFKSTKKNKDKGSSKETTNKSETSQPKSVEETSVADNSPTEGAKGTEGSDKVAEGTDKSKEAKEDGTDWCIIGAMGYEMASAAMQSKFQDKGSKTEAQIPDAQLRSLVNLKETHKARKKSATYQATAYGLVTSCYAASIAFGQLTMSWQNGVKMAGAALLTTLYMKKAKKHDRLAAKVQKVIDALPKTGECNPWTQSACFCTEKTSKELYPAEYHEVCELNKGNFDTPIAEMGCATQAQDGTVSIDDQCQCKKTNTCLKVKVSAINPSVSGAANLMSQMQAGNDLLNSGLYDEAKLSAYSTQAAAMGSKLSRQIKNPEPESISLTPEQKDVARDLAGLVTPELAARVASATPDYPENSIAKPGAAATLSNKKIEEKSATGAVNTRYKTGSSMNSGSRDNGPGFVMPNLLGKKEQASASTEVINFANKAVENADVSNAPDTPIFDIISNRYRHTWKRLDGSAQALE